MPVYLVAYRAARRHAPRSLDPYTLFSMWADFIRGPVLHVELAFVAPGRPTRASLIVLKDGHATFVDRRYADHGGEYVIDFYDLPGVDETRAETYCRDAAIRRVPLSFLTMAMSATPLEDERLARFALSQPTVSGVRDEARRAALQNVQRNDAGEFCASLTALAIRAGLPLDRADAFCPAKSVRRLTASDVLTLATRALGSREVVPRPVAVHADRTDAVMAAPRDVGADDAEDRAVGFVRGAAWDRYESRV